MTEQGREIWLAGFGSLLIAVLAYFKLCDGATAVTIIAGLTGGTMLTRTIYKGTKPNGNGGEKK